MPETNYRSFPVLLFLIDDSNPCDRLPSGAFVPHPSDCSKYYHCNHNVAVDQTCGSGLYWDTSCSCCNHAHLVTCQQGEILLNPSSDLGAEKLGNNGNINQGPEDNGSINGNKNQGNHNIGSGDKQNNNVNNNRGNGDNGNSFGMLSTGSSSGRTCV